jgi:uncharacterized protein (DUF58 family)
MSGRTEPPAYGREEVGDRGVGADDFVGLRGYHAGDSLRHVDWKALARGRGLLSRQFGGDRADQVWIDWEGWPGLETEARLSRLCRCILDAARSQVDYGLRLPGREIEPAHGTAHEHRCLAALARFEGPE